MLRVVVRRRDGQRVVVELARHEAADHEVARLEGEVHGRRLVDAPGDRLEVADVERERPQVAVPADHVERVVVVVVGRDPIPAAHADHVVAMVGDRRHLVGRADVAVVVGRVLQQLAVLVAIAPRRLDLGRALQPQHPLLDARCRHEPIGGADGDDQVVAGAVLDRAEVRLQRARALVHEEHLVRHAIAVVVTHRLRRADHPERHVGVEEERHAPGQRVTGGFERLGVDQVMPMRRGAAGVGRLDLHGTRVVDLVRLGRRRVVVEERRASGEALDPEELLRVQRSVVAAELGVALVGHASALHVEHVAILRTVRSRDGHVAAVCAIAQPVR